MGGERVEVRIGGQSIAAEKGANLMQALVTADVLLRSDCGGRGRCGKCLVRAEGPGPDRVSPPENRERELLSEESLHAGWRLACCTRVFGPIAIEISDGSLLVPEVVQKGSPTVVAGFS